MMISALLKTESKDAGSVARSLDVDNVDMEGLKMKTSAEKNAVVTKIEARNLSTLINTLDDLICCQAMAEKTIA